MREAASEVRGVPESGLPPGGRPDGPRSSAGSPRDRRVSDARRRAVLAARCRLRQAVLGGRRRCLRRHLPCHGLGGCRRALALWRRGTRLVFFTEPVMTSMARRMGCYLITETMARRHELSLESHDRLFPNQDTLPRGGFGNLIALSLQHDARQ